VGDAGEPTVLVHAAGGPNVAATVTVATGDVDDTLARAALVVRRRIKCGRLTALPIEPRATLARWDAATESLHVWTSTQMPYGVRQRIVDALGLSAESVRVTAPDVGGGFGTKGPVYPEEVIVATLARRLERPVKWTDTRQDSFISTTHAGDQLHDVTIALDADGRILALADDFVIDAGAYFPRGAVVVNVTATHLVGLYRIPPFSVADAWSRLTRRRPRRTAGPDGDRPRSLPSASSTSRPGSWGSIQWTCAGRTSSGPRRCRTSEPFRTGTAPRWSTTPATTPIFSRRRSAWPTMQPFGSGSGRRDRRGVSSASASPPTTRL